MGWKPGVPSARGVRAMGWKPGVPSARGFSRNGVEAWGGSPVLAGVGKFLEMDRWPRFAPRFAPRFWALTWVALVFSSNASRSGGDDFRRTGVVAGVERAAIFI